MQNSKFEIQNGGWGRWLVLLHFTFCLLNCAAQPWRPVQVNSDDTIYKVTNFFRANTNLWWPYIPAVDFTAIPAGTITTGMVDSVAYDAFTAGGGSGTTYTNNTDAAGVITGSGIGTNLTAQATVAGLSRQAVIYVDKTGDDATAVVGDQSRPFLTLGAAAAEQDALVASGLRPVIQLGAGTFDISGDTFIPVSTNCTLRGQGWGATTIYSTNFVSGDVLNMLVLYDNATVEDVTVWSNPPDGTSTTNITVPIFHYGSSNAVVRRVFIRGESDGIITQLGAVNQVPKLFVYDTYIDTTCDAVYFNPVSNASQQTNMFAELNNCFITITRPEEGFGWSSALSASAGVVRMNGGFIHVNNNSNVNAAAYWKSSSTRGRIEMNGVTIRAATNAWRTWTNAAGAAQIVLNGCHQTGIETLSGTGPATSYVQSTNTPSSTSYYANDGALTYWTTNIPIGAITGQQETNAAHAQLLSGIPQRLYASTNAYRISGAGTSAADGVYVWSGSAYTNTASTTKFITNESGMWGIKQSTALRYTNGTLDDTWAVANGSAPAPKSSPALGALDVAGTAFLGAIVSSGGTLTNISTTVLQSYDLTAKLWPTNGGFVVDGTGIRLNGGAFEGPLGATNLTGTIPAAQLNGATSTGMVMTNAVLNQATNFGQFRATNAVMGESSSGTHFAVSAEFGKHASRPSAFHVDYNYGGVACVQSRYSNVPFTPAGSDQWRYLFSVGSYGMYGATVGDAHSPDGNFWGAKSGASRVLKFIGQSSGGVTTNSAIEVDGTFYPSNALNHAAYSAAYIQANMTNGGFWMGTISNGLHAAWMSNNVVQWKLLAP